MLSENIAELAKALATAQGKIVNAAKNQDNPHFKSKFADLAGVWDVIRLPLSENGLSVVQLPRAQGNQVTITTILLHSSGQSVTNELTLSARDASIQSIGSAITYGRRYALQAVCGVAQEDEDDDGNAAQGVADKAAAAPKDYGKKKPVQPPQPPQPPTYDRDKAIHKIRIAQLVAERGIAEDCRDDAVAWILDHLHGKEIVPGAMATAMNQWAEKVGG